MKTNIKIYPYKAGSASAKALAEALGVKRLKREGPLVLPKHKVINWGSSRILRPIADILNKPESVANASNKLTTLKLFAEAGVASPAYTEDRGEALKWLATDDVVARKVLNGHSGAGIEITTSLGFRSGQEQLPDAPLYTKYTKKKDEYRIHVFDGKVIFRQRKARKKEVPDEEVNWQVRNLAGGFIFANDEVIAPDVVQELAIKAVAALGLDFGAADIGYKDGQAVCYEVNTACGLMGKTVEAYANAIRERLGK